LPVRRALDREAAAVAFSMKPDRSLTRLVLGQHIIP
jgi:hypothetical protein